MEIKNPSGNINRLEPVPKFQKPVVEIKIFQAVVEIKIGSGN